jgi:hypothetical protein
LFDPAASCSYSLPVSAAPTVPFATPLLLARSVGDSGLDTSVPPSVIFQSFLYLQLLVHALSPLQESLYFLSFNGSFSITTKNSLPK